MRCSENLLTDRKGIRGASILALPLSYLFRFFGSEGLEPHILLVRQAL